MALVGNGVRLGSSNPMRVLGGAQAMNVDRANWGKHGSQRNRFSGEANESGVTNTQSIPSGYMHPSAWVMAPKAGGIASRNEVNGTGELTDANLAGGLYGESAITGTGTISDAAGTLLIYASATIAGSGTISADVLGLLELAASLAGAGDLTGALNSVLSATADLVGTGSLTADAAAVLSATAALAGAGSVTADLAGAINAAATIVGSCSVSADVVGIWDMACALAGSGDVVAAMTAIGHVTAALTGTGSVTSADMRGFGSISADILVSSSEALTTASIAAAVWNSLVASFQDAGSMGEALSTAGSGGLSPTQQTMLTELYRLAGLDATRPLVVTSTTREAGAEIEQSIVEAPAGTITVTRE